MFVKPRFLLPVALLVFALALVAACNDEPVPDDSDDNNDANIDTVEPSPCLELEGQSAFAREPGDNRITLGSPVPEQPRVVLAEIAGITEGLVLVRDRVDNETIRYTTEAEPQTGTLARAEAGDESPDDAAFAPPLSAELGQAEFRRDDETTGRIVIAATAGQPELVIEINSFSPGGYLAGARLLRVDERFLYISQEELLQAQGTFRPRSFVVRHDRRNSERAHVEIPVTAEFGNSNYVDVDSYGNVVYLRVLADDVEVAVKEFDAQSPPAEAPPVLVPQIQNFEDFDFDAFAAFIRTTDPQAPQAPMLTTRDDIVQRALSFLDARWELKCSNYMREGLESRCAQPAALWRRPARLDGNFDQEVKALPYKWGGYMNLQQFMSRLEQDKVAGDTCTCRDASVGYCIVAEAVGLDCSGFVSQSWGVSYHSTMGIPNVSTEIAWADLQPGDALNKPGSHVRLFLGFAEGDELAFDIIESALSCGGICRKTLTAVQMAGYTPVRPNHIQ